MRWIQRFVDPLARGLLLLRTVSPEQAGLRLLGLAATVAALLLTMPGGLFSGLGPALLSLAAIAGLIASTLAPDSDLGLLAPAAVVLALVPQAELTVGRAVLVALCLLAAHCAWALAATIPLHGRLTRAAWALTGRAHLVVLVASAAGALLVLLVSRVDLGPWMLVPAVLALAALTVVVLPRRER